MRAQLLAAPDPDVNPLVPTWAELVLVAVIFVALVYIFAKYISPQFEKAFKERRDAIEGGIARAEAAQLEAARTLEQYQHQLADARGEAAQIRENARAEAQRIVEDLRTEAREESARILARGEEQLASQRGQIVRELRGEIGTLAVELSEKIVGQRLADDDQVRATVDAFIAGLDASDTASSGSTSSSSV
jgi:F-type H+-transporting ATPase subunit b